MRPFLKDGDVIEVSPVEAQAVRIGDVILYRSPAGRAIVHRVIGLDGNGQNGADGLTTKGDAMPGADEPVRPEQVLGRVVAVERERKRVETDGWLQRLLGVCLARLSPHSPRILPPLGRILHALRYFGLGASRET
jgi:signal peptidase